MQEEAASAGELLTSPSEQVLPPHDLLGTGSDRLLEIPSHAHRSPQVVFVSILSKEALNI
ncbi:hypothetical protein GCM10010515_19430 [Streptomyces fructofermentans]|uniref:Uncharacterized protein n=1 Tax=Streptomyces fructofermentans TaxID=152141 RepID=A0A918K935_9ACTN|nr:hypothetical protein GCM10010515_19430 [Streptomyces fructofermentans]